MVVSCIELHEFFSELHLFCLLYVSAVCCQLTLRQCWKEETTFHFCWEVKSNFKLVWMESIPHQATHWLATRLSGAAAHWSGHWSGLVIWQKPVLNLLGRDQSFASSIPLLYLLAEWFCLCRWVFIKCFLVAELATSKDISHVISSKFSLCMLQSCKDHRVNKG
jgi:hypothetical protein